ncbi:MAG: hypothetical protein ABIQ31_04260 [Ferruginibacter sp.]
MGILYFILAIILYAILSPLGMIYGLLVNAKGTNNKFIRFAECIDRAGNVLCPELFNRYLLKDSKHLFGDGRETISSVIGRNVLAGTLSPFGKRINGLLDKVKKNHSVENIGF